MAGMNIRRGRDAFKANTDAGRILYPEPESATNEHLAVVAEGDWVAVLLKRRARTNKVEDYENLYGMFYEVIDGKIATQVEMLDFRVAADKFDLSALLNAWLISRPTAEHLETTTVMSDEDQSAKPKTSTRDRDDIAGRLAEWLRGVTGADEMPVVGGLDAPDKGGLSSDTLLADLSWTAGGQRHDRRVAVRLPPPVDAWPVFPTYDLGRQAAAMEAVRRGTSVPVPEVIWYEPDAAPLGDPFIVMDRVDGVAAPDYLPYTWGSWVTELTRDQQAVVADHCIDLLAAIHGADVTPEISDALELRAFDGSPLRRHFESERARYESGARRSPLPHHRARIRSARSPLARTRAGRAHRLG